MFIIMNPKELRRTSRLSLKTKKHRYAVRKRSSIQVEWLPDILPFEMPKAQEAIS